MSRYAVRGGHIWLVLLTLCVVFAATAGVREALATRTEALRQTLAAAPALASAITVTGPWQSIATALAGPFQPPPLLSQQQTSEIARQLRADLNQGVVRLAPAAVGWTALTTQLNPLTSTLTAVGGTPVELEVTGRQPLSQHVRLLSGAFPGIPQPAPAEGNLGPKTGFYPVLPVMATEQTAARFGLKPGSALKIRRPGITLLGQASTITLVVSGIVAPTDPDSAFWTSDAAAAAPDLDSSAERPHWVGGLLAAPGESQALQADFGRAGLTVAWTFPLALGGLNGQQAQPLSDALTGLGSRTLPLSSDVGPVASELTASSGLVPALASFIAAARSADVLLWLLYVSLTVAGLVVLLLAGQMVVLRQSAELALTRARGASLWQLGGAVGGAAAAGCVPAAAAAVALAVLAVPGAGGLQPAAGTWWPLLAVLLIAICGPALMATWRNRLPRRRVLRRRQRRAPVRAVAEVFLIAAAAGGILILRQQGLQAGSGVNLYTSAAPALIAVPAVIVVFRLYPLVLRWLLRAAARTGGAPAFLGLARAARTALTPALPAFALVLALTVAAFGGMVRDAVANGQVAASWQAVGADATIAASPAAASFTIPAAAARAVAAVPGVNHAAQVYQDRWFSPNGAEVTGIAVDPAAYAALVAATQGYPAVPAGLLAAPAAGRPQPVLASPAAAAALGSGPVVLSTRGPAGPVKVRVAGTLAGTPAQPGALAAGPAFVIMPLAAVKSAETPPGPVLANEILLTGRAIDRGQLTAVVRSSLSGAEVTFRSDVLAGLAGAPLQRGAVTVITLSIVAAAALGLAIMLLELALGATEREATLARLATMGLGERQRGWLVALELLPAVTAAGLTAWVCALILPPAVGPVIDLSVFTGSSAAVPLEPDAAAVALPLAGLLVLAAVSLGIEIRAGRRCGAASALRAGG